jgi:hypothetical protein
LLGGVGERFGEGANEGGISQQRHINDHRRAIAEFVSADRLADAQEPIDQLLPNRQADAGMAIGWTQETRIRNSKRSGAPQRNAEDDREK